MKTVFDSYKVKFKIKKIKYKNPKNNINKLNLAVC